MKIINTIEKKINTELQPTNKLKFTFFLVIIFSFIANAYCWFDFNFSHDSTSYIQNDYLWQISIGRYLHGVYIFFRGELFSPFVVGILSTIWLGIATYFLIKIFDIKKISNIILTAGLMAANSVITYVTATYIFEMDIYMFSLMCSILAVYAAQKNNRGWIISIILFAISLGLYQSYWQVGIIIILFSLIKDLLLKEKYQDIIKKGLKYLIILVSSLVLYLIGYKLFLAFYNMTPSNSYNSLSNVNNLLNFNILFSLFKNTYIYFFQNTLNIHTYNAKIVHYIIIIGYLCSIIYIILKMHSNKIKIKEKIITFLVILLVPLGGNIIYVITQGMVHELMTYSFFILYIFFLVLWESTKEDNRKIDLLYGIVVTIMCATIVFNNVIYSNQVYMKKHTNYNYTYSLMNRIINDTEKLDDYVVGETPVVFIGNLEDSKYNYKREYYDYSVSSLNTTLAVTYDATYKSYINNVMSYPMNIMTDSATIKEYESKEEIKEMSSYPSKNSIKMIDGIVFIKLSDKQ